LRPATSTGASSSASRPPSCAAAKRFWLSTEKASTSSWLIAYCVARFSAVIAIGSPV
jgi:hypothetical protein